MSHFLTLSIPFILLGRRSICNPTDCTNEPLLTIVHKTLQRFCPNISIVAWQPETRPGHAKPLTPAEDSWAALDIESTTKWLLRPAPHATKTLAPFDTARGWRKGDARLSPTEASRLSDDLWECPLLLQRFGVPADTTSSAWTFFAHEAREICGVLAAAFVNFEGPVPGVSGKARYWDVVFGQNCFLRMLIESDGSEVDFDMGRKVVMLQAAFERELDLLRSVGEVVEFAGVSRWLEGVLLRRLVGEKREAWRELERSGRGSEDKVVWKSSISAAEERYRKAKNRGREWWDLLHDMEIEDLLQQMHRFRTHGLRLGVSVHASKDGAPHIVFQGQRSTLDPDHLIAFTELIARFVNVAANHNIAELAQWLEGLQSDRPVKLVDRFANLLALLAPNKPNVHTALHAALLPRLTPPADPLMQSTPPLEAVNPFYKLKINLETSYEGCRKDMARFMDRYESAGGYMPTKEEKLCAMIKAGEERQVQDVKRHKHSSNVTSKAGACIRSLQALDPPMTDDGPGAGEASVAAST